MKIWRHILFLEHHMSIHAKVEPANTIIYWDIEKCHRCNASFWRIFFFKLERLKKNSIQFPRIFSPILMIHIFSLGSCEAPHKIWARSVQLLWLLLITNEQTDGYDRQTSTTKVFLGSLTKLEKWLKILFFKFQTLSISFDLIFILRQDNIYM